VPTRTWGRTPRPPGGPAPRGSLRTVLLALAVVPSVALVLLWALSSDRLFSEWRTQTAQDDLATRAGRPASQLYFALQDERLATTKALNGQSASGLTAARGRTDAAVRTVQQLEAMGHSKVGPDVRAAVTVAGQELQKLGGIRVAADHRALSQADAFTYYTGLISADIDVLEALSRADNGDVVVASENLVELFWNGEVLSQEDALLARRTLTASDRGHLVEWIGACWAPRSGPSCRRTRRRSCTPSSPAPTGRR
jgi:hypothetical protein